MNYTDHLEPGDTGIARALNRLGAALLPTPVAMRRAEQQLHGVLDDLRRPREVAAPKPWFAPRPRLVLASAAALVAAVVIVGVLLAGSGLGLGTSTSEAVNIQGNVTATNGRGFTVETSGSTNEISLAADATVLDAFGNPVDTSSLAPGTRISLSGRRHNGDLVAERVELVDKLFGTIGAFDGRVLTINSPSGVYHVAITSETKMEGRIAAGAAVEVETQRAGDGTLFAKEVEIENDEGDESEGPGNGDDSIAPSSGSAPVAAPVDDRSKEAEQDSDSSEDKELVLPVTPTPGPTAVDPSGSDDDGSSPEDWDSGSAASSTDDDSSSASDGESQTSDDEPTDDSEHQDEHEDAP